MASRTLRRRLQHRDVDGKNREYLKTLGIDDLNEPLLGNREDDDGHSEQNNNLGDKSWDDEENKQKRHWTSIFSNLIAQWAQWLAHIVLGSGSVIGRLISFNGEHKRNTVVSLSPLQEERLKSLQQRLGIPFDGTLAEHQDALKQLWRLAYPDRELPPLKSELWKEMGWQGSDPSTDFRGGGFVSLENLIFFAKKYPESFHKLLLKKEGKRAEWEYPFAVAGINISFMLAQMLDLQSVILVSQSSSILDVLLRCMGCERDTGHTATLNGKPTSIAGSRFLELLGEDEMAFDNLYCVAFQMMDAQWLAKRASYMQFNEVLKSTRIQLERELALEDVSTVKDLPAYNLLNR